MNKLFLITLLFITVIFVQCGSPTQNGTFEVEQIIAKDSCGFKKNKESSFKIATQSEITCPNCAFKKMETMPTEVCLIKYICDSCKTISYSKDGDCCVFCSYGTHKCPSKQDD